MWALSKGGSSDVLTARNCKKSKTRLFSSLGQGKQPI